MTKSREDANEYYQLLQLWHRKLLHKEHEETQETTNNYNLHIKLPLTEDLKEALNKSEDYDSKSQETTNESFIKKQSKYCSFLIPQEIKRKCLAEIASGCSFTEVGSKYKVSTNSLSKWKKNGITSNFSPIIEFPIRKQKLLIDWYNSQPKAPGVTRAAFQNKARSLADDRRFIASKHWTQRFLKKYPHIQLTK